MQALPREKSTLRRSRDASSAILSNANQSWNVRRSPQDFLPHSLLCCFNGYRASALSRRDHISHDYKRLAKTSPRQYDAGARTIQFLTLLGRFRARRRYFFVFSGSDSINSFPFNYCDGSSSEPRSREEQLRGHHGGRSSYILNRRRKNVGVIKWRLIRAWNWSRGLFTPGCG